MWTIAIALLVMVRGLQAQDAGLRQAELSIEDAIEAGDLAGASRLIDTALKQHPGDGGLLNLRGIAHARRNELVHARKDFSEAVRAAPGLTPAWQNLARACQLQAERDTASASCAINSWQHVLRLKPDDGEAHSSLGLLYERQRKFAESLQNLEKLPEEQRSEPANLLLRCADLSALGRVAEAEKAASQVADRGDFSQADFDGVQNAFDSPKAAGVAVRLIEGLDRRHATSPAGLRRLAIAYEELQRPADARKVLERLVTLDPKNTAHLLELARLADRSKDYEGALGYLAHARDLAPDNPQIHFLFAMVADEMDLAVEARRSLERALALDPENPAYNFAMGFVILKTRDAATASTYFEKFVKAQPANAKGHYALGIAYFASGDYAKSKQEMQRIEDHPSTAGGAEYFLGRIARLEGQSDEAIRHLHKSIELMPSFSESHTELARVLMLEGKREEAHQELDCAVRLDPQSFEANAQLLVLYRKTHDSRAEKQSELLKKLDEDRSRRAELMLRTIEVRP